MTDNPVTVTLSADDWQRVEASLTMRGEQLLDIAGTDMRDYVGKLHRIRAVIETAVEEAR